MTYTDEDKKFAKSIVENEALIAFLAKVLIEPREQLSAEIIASKTNEELGELVRADTFANEKIAQRFARLKNLAASQQSKPPNIAPK